MGGGEFERRTVVGDLSLYFLIFKANECIDYSKHYILKIVKDTKWVRYLNGTLKLLSVSITLTRHEVIHEVLLLIDSLI